MVTLGVLVLVLSSCAGMSGTSTVRPGLDVGGAEVPVVRVVFPGPVNGAGPEQIVRGFLRAGAASDGDYSTAKSFLTEDAGRRWQPDGEIVIFSTEADVSVEMTGDARARLSAPIVARIDTKGRYSAAANGDQGVVDIDLARIDGEWRIAGVPEGFGRWIATAEVRRLVRPYAVHYVLNDRRALVEDLRWFPLDRLTSRLARAQLEAVPADLAGVASTAVPSGARLAADSVSVTYGVATVELSTRLPADQTLRQNVWAQFVATLTQDPSVISVALRADGASIDLPGVSAAVSDPTQVGFSAATPVGPRPQVLVRRGEQLAALDPLKAVTGGDPTPSPSTGGPDLPVIPQAWVGLALSADGREFAGVSRDRSALARWRGRERYDVQVPEANALADPAYDPRGQLWVGGAAPEGGVSPLAVVNLGEAPATAVARPVAAAWLAGRVVKALRISPDSARVAVLSRSREGDVRLDVAGILRTAAGMPTALTTPVLLAAGNESPTGVSWLDTTRIATLTGPSKGEQVPVVISLDGTTTALPVVQDGAAICTPDGERALMVRTAADEILVRSGQLWVSAGPGTDVLIQGR